MPEPIDRPTQMARDRDGPTVEPTEEDDDGYDAPVCARAHRCVPVCACVVCPCVPVYPCVCISVRCHSAHVRLHARMHAPARYRTCTKGTCTQAHTYANVPARTGPDFIFVVTTNMFP